MKRDYLLLDESVVPHWLLHTFAESKQSVRDVIAKVSAETGVAVEMLIGERRTRELTQIRHYAYWRAAKETTVGIVAIARAFGDRCHSTVAFGIRQHEQRLKRALQG